MIRVLLIVATALIFSKGTCVADEPLRPTALRCEYRQYPIGIDDAVPSLMWRVESDERGQKQTAHALAMLANLVPDGIRNKTTLRLAEMIEFNGNHMATGFLGTRPLLPVLSTAGQHDLATFLL